MSNPDLPKSKVCNKCHNDLPASEYHLKKVKGGRVILNRICKPCRKIENAEYYRKRSAKIREAKKKERQEKLIKESKEKLFKLIESVKGDSVALLAFTTEYDSLMSKINNMEQ